VFYFDLPKAPGILAAQPSAEEEKSGDGGA